MTNLEKYQDVRELANLMCEIEYKDSWHRYSERFRNLCIEENIKWLNMEVKYAES